MCQQPLFAFFFAAITAYLAIAADYTVAGDDNGNPVFSIGIANCSSRVGFSKPDCQLRIAAGLAEWDFLQGLPDCLLKRAAGFAGLEINPKTA